MEYWRGVRQAGGIPKHKKLRVLAYHAIRDLAQAPIVEAYGMPPSQFRRQIDLLRRTGFRFVTADEFLKFLQTGDCGRRWPVLLTFDDGYAELADTVLPILSKRQIPAVAFVVSGLVGGSNEWDQKIGAPRLPLLDVDGLRRLSSQKVEIGAHSRTHKALSQLPDEQLIDEVAGSVTDLHANGFDRPRLFAYPEGVHDARVRQATRNARLSAAFTVDTGHVSQGHDPFEIPRIEIMRGDVGWRFLWKVINA
jgi:peptidoglycan/xylan/chitin deacetylase (PgdA/CDA1 family)